MDILSKYEYKKLTLYLLLLTMNCKGYKDVYKRQALYLHRISAESTHFIYIRMIIISNNRLITIFTDNIYIFHP